MSAFNRIRNTICLVLVALLVVPPPLHADEITTLTAAADATLQQGSPAINDGTTAILRVLGVTAEAKRSLVRFDLSPIDSTAAVKVANLKMQVAQAPASSKTIAVHRVTGATQWTEGGVTWDSRDGTAPNNWTTPGGDFSATAVSTQASGTTNGVTLNWSVLSDGVIPNIVQNWLTTPANNLGLLVKDTSESAAARAVVQTVHSGTFVSTGAAPPATLSANLGTCNGATPTVDINKSFLMFQTTNDTIRPNGTEIRGRIVPHACPTTPPSVQFFRTTNETSTVNISWYVVEFARGVSVQRGSVSQSVSTINVPITAVSSTSRAFVLWSKTPAAADPSFSQDDPVIGDLTATNNLQFRVNASNAAHVIDWEVVEFTNPADATVQRGTSTAMTSFTLSVTLPIAAVDPTKSFALVSYRIPGGSASIGRLLLRGRLSNCTPTCNQLIVDRSVGGSAISEIAYQVVTLNNGSTVQTASTNLASFVLSASPALSPSIDTTRSVAFTSTLSGGGANFGRSPLASPLVQSLGVSAFTTSLASSAITLTRGNGNDQADVSWYVAEMNNVSTNGVNFSAREDGTPANRPQLDVSFLRDVAFGVNSVGISDITLNFTYPCASSATCSYQGALVARKNGASPPTFAPNDGSVYIPDTQPVFGETVVSNADSVVDPPTVVTVVDENGPDNVVLPGTQYSYKVYTRDNVTITGAANPSAPHYSFGTSATLTTLTGGGANKIWSYKTAGTALAPPGLDPANKVIAASNDNNLHSMTAVAGARNYKPGGSIGNTGGPVQTRPAVISQGDTQITDCDSVTPGNQPCDIAYLGSNDGRVYAFNAITGAVIWSTPVPGAVGSLVAVGGIIQGGIAAQLKNYAGGTFTPTTDLVFVGTRELSPLLNKVYALNGSTGAIVWTFSPGNMDAVNSTPVVDYANNVLWVTSLSNGGLQPSLWKIDSITGAPLANFSLGDISGSPTLNLFGKVVYVVTDAGDLVAVRNDIPACTNTFASGATSGTGFPIPVASSTSSDSIFFTTTTVGAGTLRKVNFSFNLACGGETFVAAGGYTNPSGIGTISTPIWNPLTGFMYVGSSDGNIYKINPADGTVAGSRLVNSGITIGDPSVDVFLARILVGDTQGRIYSFDVF
ncbi:MAG: DNRLRE domain-containing protein [Acidobacteria bacterium]|nr:DNRLRE domain-containing protein [Acidobacteriota bacterium]MCL5289125.1 DNRLRE domain-containing protein [Acidobacteriota bacterium]